MQNPNELWEEIKTFYKEKFNIEPRLVDVMSDFNIIRLCASGSSNKQIANMFEMDEKDISYLLNKYFEFEGWLHNVPFSPSRIYKGLDTKDKESFKNTVISQFGYIDDQVLDNMYKSSEIVSELERILDDEWV